jgi:hypothetical protein
MLAVEQLCLKVNLGKGLVNGSISKVITFCGLIMLVGLLSKDGMIPMGGGC